MPFNLVKMPPLKPKGLNLDKNAEDDVEQQGTSQRHSFKSTEVSMHWTLFLQRISPKFSNAGLDHEGSISYSHNG